MRPIALGTAATLALALLSSPTWGQQLLPVPDPVASPTNVAPAVPTPAATTADAWRYCWNDGYWWYWTPQNNWLMYHDGRWVAYDPTSGGSRVYGPVLPAQAVAPVYAAPVYPAPGYRGPVGVRPWGGVNVGVGRRIEVNVWGGHGGVHVGRIGVGW